MTENISTFYDHSSRYQASEIPSLAVFQNVCLVFIVEPSPSALKRKDTGKDKAKQV